MGNIYVRNHRILLFVSALVLFFILLLMFTTHAFAAATYTIRDDATGGDCASIGEWNPATKTCRVTQDISVASNSGIVIEGNGITLDGNGHSLTNSLPGSCGICAFSVQDVTIKNFKIESTNSTIAISVYAASGLRITGCEISGSMDFGMNLSNVHNSVVSGNRLTGSPNMAISMDLSSLDQIAGNYFSDNICGIFLRAENTFVIISDNYFLNNMYGAYLMNEGSSNDNYIFSNNFHNSPSWLDMGNFSSLDRPVGGNYWSTWNTPDVDADGFVDMPYLVGMVEDALPLSQPLNMSGRPDLVLVNDGAYWASYADYIARSLTVSYSIRNNGQAGAYAVSVSAATSTGGVSLTTALPVYFGSIGPMDTNSRLLKYAVPAGVVSFRADLNATALDLTGMSYTYP